MEITNARLILPDSIKASRQQLMKRFLTFFCTLIAFRSWVAALLLPVGSLMAVDFQCDVRPVLAAHCFKCHGPDEKTRKAKLRLDIRPELDLFDEILSRIDHSDFDELMPPPAAKKPLSVAQKKMLRAWVKAGAIYTEHWAFIPPKRPVVPKVKQVDWPRNDLDHFILLPLEKEGRAPSPPADRRGPCVPGGALPRSWRDPPGAAGLSRRALLISRMEGFPIPSEHRPTRRGSKQECGGGEASLPPPLSVRAAPKFGITR